MTAQQNDPLERSQLGALAVSLLFAWKFGECPFQGNFWYNLGDTAMGFKQPTPIQKACIPVGLLGKDICACAATGTGTEDRELGWRRGDGTNFLVRPASS